MGQEDLFGYLRFYRKNGELANPYPLSYGITTIGSSTDADIRLKINDSRLEDIHCIIDVNNDGMATIVNKSQSTPIKVNETVVKMFKVLNDGDKFEVVRKLFLYSNSNVSKKDVANMEKILHKAISPPAKRQSALPVLSTKSPKTPNVRTKTPLRKRLSKRTSTGILQSSQSEFIVTVTPEKIPDTRNITEKSKTTSKLVSKALSSPPNLKRKRLSLGDRRSIGRSPKISSRNVLLSQKGSKTPDIKSLIDTTVKIGNLGTPLAPKSLLETIKDNEPKTPVNSDADTSKRSARSSVKKSIIKRHSSTPKATLTPNDKPRVSSAKTPLELPSPIVNVSARRSIHSRLSRSNNSIENNASSKSLELPSPIVNNSSRSPIENTSSRKRSSASNKSLELHSPIVNISSRRSINKSLSIELPSPIEKDTSSRKIFNLSNKVRKNLSESVKAQNSIEKRSKSRGSRDSSPIGSDFNVSLQLSESESLQAVDDTTRRTSSRKSRDNSVLLLSDDSLSVNTPPNNKDLEVIVIQSSLKKPNKNDSRKSPLVKSGIKKASTPYKTPSLRKKLLQSLVLDESLDIMTPREKALLEKKLQQNTSFSSVDSLDFTISSPTKKSRSRNTSTVATESSKKVSIVAQESGNDSYTTPENNKSVVIINTPLSSPKKNKSRSLIDLDDEESTTPKSAIKGIRSKSLPYKPKTEEITPATPDKHNKTPIETFKTPLNTPVVFESIKKSVLKSRLKQSERKLEAEKRGVKRGRDSSIAHSSKKVRLNVSNTSSDLSMNNTFDSDDFQPIDSDVTNISVSSNESFSKLKSRQSVKGPRLNKSLSLSVPKTSRARNSIHAINFTDANVDENESFSKVSNKQDVKGPRLNKSLSLSVPKTRRVRNSVHAINYTEESPQLNISITHLNQEEDESFSKVSDRHNIKGARLNKSLSLSVPKTRRVRNSVHAIKYTEQLSKLNARKRKTADSPENDLTNVSGVKQLMKTPKVQNSPRNDLTEISGVKRLMKTPKNSQHSPKNDLTNVAGVKKLLKTPRGKAKSPKNDLTNVQGVKQLLKTPKAQNSPKNDLTNIAGVKGLLKTPRGKAKSPKNDLTNVQGVKQLLKTPKAQNSPKNDLTNVAGVKKLLKTPRGKAKSPKNDLTNVQGVKQLLKTPKAQNSPKNDLTNVAGVKKLLKTPRGKAKSPKNDLTNVQGVKQLLKTPKAQNSPKNDLTEISGVKKLLQSPKEIKSPKNDLTNVAGVKKLLKTPKAVNSPKNDLSNVAGVKKLFQIRKNQASTKNDLSDVEGVKELFNSSMQTLRVEVTNDVTQESKDELFDKVAERKPLRTYKGRSLSPKKYTGAKGISRKSIGDIPSCSPNLERWVQEQNKLIEEGRPALLEIDVQSKTPNSKAKANKENVSPKKEEIAVASTSRRGRRRVMTDVDIEEPTALSFTEKTEPTRGGRKRKNEKDKKSEDVKRKAVEEIVIKVEEAAKTTRRRKVEDVKEEAKPSPKTASRRKKAEVLVDNKPSPKRTRRGKVVEEEASTPKKTRRGKQVEEIVKEESVSHSPLKQVQETVEELVKKTTRRRKADTPKAESPLKLVEETVHKNTRRKRVDSKPEESSSSPKSGRRHKKIEVEEVKASPQKTRGRRKKVEEAVIEKGASPKKTRATRKKIIEQETNEIEEQDKKEPSPKKTIRRKNVGKVQEEEAQNKKTRGRPAKAKIEEVVDSPKPARPKKKVQFEEDASVEVRKSKRTRK